MHLADNAAVSTLDRVCMCACMTAPVVPSRQGEVLAWGINDFGQLGNGSTFYETSPTQVQRLIPEPQWARSAASRPDTQARHLALCFILQARYLLCAGFCAQVKYLQISKRAAILYGDSKPGC